MPAASRRPPVSAVELDRRAYRRQQNTRSVLVSLISTIVFAVVVWLTVINTPGWSRVQQSFFDIETAIEAWPRVIAGLWVNVQVLFFAVIGVLVLSVLIATVRTLRGPVWFPLRALAAAYTDLFRGIPLIIVLFLVGFGLPGLELFPRNSAQFWGTIALILTYSAYVSEVFRAGIEAVHPSQRLAARSLGLNHGQTMRIVVLPQAVRKVTPALMNDFVAMQKDVGLISVLGVVDAVRAAQIETAANFNFTPYVLAGLLFVLLALPMIRLTDWYTARLRAREQIGTLV
ncbi:amino acid ABC transporter membrane protein (PAAT family) [Microcella putealis]|uniref:Amino acid ABC transporter membrane protein (PAAT family) n=1 Tax=Microcella putealis TaxID=337005 RepID=A0A4Q7LVK0_9MICO|nr:amino acid ABC transporter permease [Microcella putealis]RZS59115.1 amino acid ABC transporter membrane protein (PAAT family) [Microcella putealis]TQM24141.1 amino acid ABC transporter membrane protein (PAAT family) [Microcella putealis]